MRRDYVVAVSLVAVRAHVGDAVVAQLYVTVLVAARTPGGGPYVALAADGGVEARAFIAWKHGAAAFLARLHRADGKSPPAPRWRGNTAQSQDVYWDAVRLRTHPARQKCLLARHIEV